MSDDLIDDEDAPQRRSTKRSGSGLFVTDAELIRLLNLPAKIGRRAIRELEKHNPARPRLPSKDALFGNRRYWPAVVQYFDVLYGLKGRAFPMVPDGNERRSRGDGKVEVRRPDGTKYIEDAKPTDPKSWHKKRELKPRTGAHDSEEK